MQKIIFIETNLLILNVNENDVQLLNIYSKQINDLFFI